MKPATHITDRAKRYRANNVMEEYPAVCMFCGSTKDLQVDHIDGFEENGEPENLLWLCRSCNQLKAAVYKRVGLGRRTVQFNPGIFSQLFGSKETYRVHGSAHPESKRARAAEAREERERERAEERELRRDESEAKRAERAAAPKQIGRYKGFTIYKRRDSSGDTVYYSSMDPHSWLDSKRQAQALIDTFKNPAGGAQIWENAVQVLRGKAPGSPFAAARVIRSTPINRRYAYLDSIMRSNPAVPTFEQYAFAVSTHERGPYLGKGKWGKGEHDEGGAIIHATPHALRREYAQRIADGKARRGGGGRKDEVPF